MVVLLYLLYGFGLGSGGDVSLVRFKGSTVFSFDRAILDGDACRGGLCCGFILLQGTVQLGWWLQQVILFTLYSP